ncbi:MAG: ABC transporter permease, partial [bacterium]|nr:ABC transporter permease [bacterium]
MNGKRQKPPWIISWLFRKTVNADDDLSISGDLEEEYQDIVLKKGTIYAIFWYTVHVLRSIPYTLKESIFRSSIMFKNYFKIAFRNIKGQKSYSIINISGLAVGLACCILMMLWVKEELSFDRFHENYNELSRIITKTTSSNQIINTTRTAPAAGPALVEQYPEIINFTKYGVFSGQSLEYSEKSLLNNYFAVADPSFFEMFSFQFISGDPSSVFNEKHSLVITESIAKLYFGDEDPMGKIMFVQ